jgi:hypothetical protein
MQARDADAFLYALMLDFDPASRCERKLVLRDLVALGQVWVKVILARETGVIADGAMQRQGSAHGHFDGAFVQDRQCSGQSEAYRANIGIRRIAEARRAAAENLA